MSNAAWRRRGQAKRRRMMARQIAKMFDVPTRWISPYVGITYANAASEQAAYYEVLRASRSANSRQQQ